MPKRQHFPPYIFQDVDDESVKQRAIHTLWEEWVESYILQALSHSCLIEIYSEIEHKSRRRHNIHTREMSEAKERWIQSLWRRFKRNFTASFFSFQSCWRKNGFLICNHSQIQTTDSFPSNTALNACLSEFVKHFNSANWPPTSPS